jgi:hypothetical protein
MYLTNDDAKKVKPEEESPPPTPPLMLEPLEEGPELARSEVVLIDNTTDVVACSRVDISLASSNPTKATNKSTTKLPVMVSKVTVDQIAAKTTNQMEDNLKSKLTQYDLGHELNQKIRSHAAVHSCVTLNSYMADHDTYIAVITVMGIFATTGLPCLTHFTFEEWVYRSLIVYFGGIVASLMMVWLDEYILKQDLVGGLTLIEVFGMGTWFTDRVICCISVGIVTVMYLAGETGFFWPSTCFMPGRG